MKLIIGHRLEDVELTAIWEL